MIYEMEALAATLKQARLTKGLSQRQLSTISGVPQSHISKIEKAGVDLRISSLNAIANALDLELTLVPRIAVPAVKSISRTTTTTPVVSPEVAKAMKQLATQVQGFKNMNIDASAIDNMLRRFRELKQFENLIPSSSELKQISETLRAMKESGALEAAQQAAQNMARIRNTLAHRGPNLTEIEHFKPKYSLEGDGDG